MKKKETSQQGLKRFTDFYNTHQKYSMGNNPRKILSRKFPDKILKPVIKYIDGM